MKSSYLINIQALIINIIHTKHTMRQFLPIMQSTQQKTLRI